MKISGITFSSSNTAAAVAVANDSHMNSISTTPIDEMAASDDNERATMEWTKLQNSLLIQRRTTEVDAALGSSERGSRSYTIGYYEIISTATSILLRTVAVYVNIRLAYAYYHAGQHDYFTWTTICIVVPMCVTTLIYANMCHQDGKFSMGFCKALQTLWIVFLSSFFFRYWNSLVYSIKCKRAELNGNKESQLRFYKLTLREESDVAFIRLFECFLEAAPQKILQISIVLAHNNKMMNIQTIAICSYFGSMAWCIAAYNRCNRYAQIDKYKINIHGLVLQLCWHFCISVSRTLCIAFVASIFPLWTLIACLNHALLFGFITFIVDRPKFAATTFLNFLFCLVLGTIYLFTYISVKDAPTRFKYLIYYLICSAENVVCVVLFIHFAANYLVSLKFLFYSLCAMAIGFYYIGIVFMIIYYLYFHPKITARKSKHIINNN